MIVSKSKVGGDPGAAVRRFSPKVPCTFSFDRLAPLYFFSIRRNLRHSSYSGRAASERGW